VDIEDCRQFEPDLIPTIRSWKVPPSDSLSDTFGGFYALVSMTLFRDREYELLKCSVAGLHHHTKIHGLGG